MTDSVGIKRRLAFVGQENYFDFVALSTPTALIEPFFINFRSGGDVNALHESIEEFAPDVLIVFGPHTIPRGVLSDVNAIRVGWFTEPIAQVSSLTQLQRPQIERMHISEGQLDLDRRLMEASNCDVNQFDRLISHDPLQAQTLELIGPIWRSVPLPVDDRFFREMSPMPSRPKIGFIGRSTPYREEFLTILKHDYDLRHFAHGLFGDRLLNELHDLDLTVNLHNLDIPTFENRVPLHLAQGHLVLSQPLTPSNGLEPDRDFIQFRSPEELAHIAAEIFSFPRSHELIRHRGRLKAEYFRASIVYEKILRDISIEESFLQK